MVNPFAATPPTLTTPAVPRNAGAVRQLTVGWIGAGLMGVPMAMRLLEAGVPVRAWNRTPAKLAPLESAGATAADSLEDLAGTDVVFSMLESDEALDAVAGTVDRWCGTERAPKVWVDCSTVSTAASGRAAAAARDHGTAFVAAPVSGNPGVVTAGAVLFAASGPEWAYELVRPLLLTIGRGSHYVGDGHQARAVKVSTNLVLGILTQAIAEALVLAERSGVTRAAFMDFLNDSPLGSTFTGYKTNAFVALDFSPTFTAEGLRKDLQLAVESGLDCDVPMALASTSEYTFSRLVLSGTGSQLDFAAILLQVAADAGMELRAETG